VAAIVHKLLAKDPDARFQTPIEFSAALSSALNDYRRKPERAAVEQAPPVAAPSPVQVADPVVIHEIPQDELSTAPLNEIPYFQEGVCANEETARDLWTQWQGVIASYTNGTNASWSEEEYRPLHSNLMASLRALGNSDPGRSHTSSKLITLVEPWLN